MRQISLLLIFLSLAASAHPGKSLLGQETGRFPTSGWLPKAETGALRFLKKHPTYDGRGVVVAIFDTGVDPGVDGLQTTPDGRPKIIDMVDGSGSGDVDTSTIVRGKEGVIVGATGRPLTIPKSWTNPSGDWRVGWKRAYELFPKDLVARVEKKRREAWDAKQRMLRAKLQSDLQDWDRKHKAPDRNQKRQRKELTDRIALLSELQKQYADPGPIYDCVVFHDGQMWQASIDTNEDGQFDDEAVMTNFREKRQYTTFDKVSLLNFAVNIYDDGNLLSIVTDCGAHGTHVAGIVSAHYPDHPERDGLAPGAQIVSVKIGDSRLGSSSTGSGQIRGMTAVLRNKCDLINMSYGGSTSDPNSGRLLARYAEVIRDHNVIFVASAGNNGPALSTVGSPGGTSSALIGVGAYVSPALMQNAYAQRLAREEQAYTWSSRGPTADGDLGVDICAPGGAISPVSQWSLMHRKLGNGTSMSSPNACGNLALLLSGLKAHSHDYSPTTVRRAVVNTARPLARMDPLAHGRGLIQIDRAYDYAVQHRLSENDLARFEISIADRENARGLYLRDAFESNGPTTSTIHVRPVMHDRAGAAAKAAFDVPIVIESESAWIKAPKHLVLAYDGKSFDIEVDGSSLPPGAHYGEVKGMNADHPERGPLFRVPVTLIRPHVAEAHARNPFRDAISLSAGSESRRFLQVPNGANWIDVTLTADKTNGQARRFVVHALQLLPQKAYGRGFQREYVTLRPGQTILRSFPVEAGHTLELCLGQYWSSVGDSLLHVETQFQGIAPRDEDMLLTDNLAVARGEVVASLGDQWFEPDATLDTLRRTVRPSGFQLRVVSTARDALPKGRRAYESITTYAFSLKEKREFTPRPSTSLVPEFSKSWESRVWQVFDSNKRLAASGRGSAKLPKGDYVLRLHLRHDQPAMLEKWKESPLLLDFKLAKPIPLAFFADPDDAVAGRPKLAPRQVHSGQRVPFYVARPKLPTFAKNGDVLHGTISYGSEKHAVAGAGRRPKGYPVRLLIASIATPTKEQATDDNAQPSRSPKSPEATPSFLLLAQRRRLTELRLSKRKDEFDELAKSILAEHKRDLPTLIERLKMLDDDDRKQRLPKIVAAANAVIKRIPQKQLAIQFGSRPNGDDPKAMAERKAWEEKKSWLVDALYRKGRAIAYMDLPRKPGDPKVIPKKPADKEARAALFEENYLELQRWVDMTEPTYVLLNIRRERRNDRPASALKLLEDLLKKQPTRALLYKKRGDLFDELDWEHWRANADAWKIIRFPKSYPRM